MRETLSETLSRSSTELETMKYLLAFLNSKAIDSLLRFKMVQKRGGYVIVGEKFLRDVKVAIPAAEHSLQVERLLQLVDQVLEQRTRGEDCANLKAAIDEIVYELLGIEGL